MTSAESSGRMGGAVAGAVAGAQIGGPWGALVGGVAGFFLGGSGGRAQDKAQANREAWARYNNEVALSTNLYNIKAATAIAAFNAQSIMMKARADQEIAYRNSVYNAGIILATLGFNQSLLETEVENVWQDLDLELEQLALFRDREKGGIIAQQAASGTVIGEGSNADVVISQETQRLLDAEVLKFGADRKVAAIRNEMAKSSWEGQVAIDRTLWEGQLVGFQAGSSGAMQSAGILAQSAIGGAADRYSATQAYEMGKAAIALDRTNFNAAQSQALTQGLFSAAGSFAQSYYMRKTPGTGTTGAGSSLVTG